MNVGDRVYNKYRISSDISENQKLKYYGSILELYEGCNRLAKVRFDGQEFDSIMVLSDLALQQGGKA